MLIETTLPKFASMTLNNAPHHQCARVAKLPLRLHDSMEYYKQKGLTTGGSPPRLPDKAEPALLVTSDEDDIVFEEENASPTTLFLSRFYYPSDSESESDEESKILRECGEDSDEECGVNINDFSDSDEIIFVDSDQEERKAKNKQSTVDSPFWFGNEDGDQIKCIMDFYYHTLKLGEEKKRLIRQPEPFVGRVTRQKVQNEEAFVTFDTVEVFRRSLLAPGSVMPLIRTVHMLTTWSFEDGLPEEILPLTNEKQIAPWKGRIVQDAEPSVLLCLPDYGSNGYHYFVAQQSLEVTHSPDSLLTTEKRCWYDEYIPENLRHPCCEEGEYSGA